MYKKSAFLFGLIFLSSPLFAGLDEEIEAALASPRTYGPGLIFMHIPKCGGTSTKDVLSKQLGITNIAENTIFSDLVSMEHTSETIPRIKHGLFTAGHCHLYKLVAHNTKKRPIITFLRNPLERLISNIRFWKSIAKDCINNEKVYMTKELDLNNILDIRSILNKTPELAMEKLYLSPLGVDASYEKMSIEKVNDIVIMALQHIDFIGTLGSPQETVDSIMKLNLALNLKIDPRAFLGTRHHKTSDAIEKITNAEVIAYLKEMVKWDVLIYEKLLDAQRWRIGIPTPQARESKTVTTQHILPKDFDPDRYLGADKNLLKIATERYGDDIWARRKFALIHYIEKKEASF